MLVEGLVNLCYISAKDPLPGIPALTFIKKKRKKEKRSYLLFNWHWRRENGWGGGDMVWRKGHLGKGHLLFVGCMFVAVFVVFVQFCFFGL